MNAPATRRARSSSTAVRRPGDILFNGASLGSAVLILLILAGVAFFLVMEAIPALTAPAEEISGGEGFFAYVWPLVFGTVVASVIAVAVRTSSKAAQVSSCACRSMRSSSAKSVPT